MVKATRSSDRYSGGRVSLLGFTSLVRAIQHGGSGAEALRAQRAEISAAARDLGPVIYGVLTKDGLIKLGYTTDLWNRLYNYGIGMRNPKRLLMVKPGTLADEQIIVGRFAAHVVHGREYFRPAREILDYINSVRAEMGVPALPI